MVSDAPAPPWGVSSGCGSILMGDDAQLGAMPGPRHGLARSPSDDLKVLTGVGRRQSFAVEDKLALVAQISDCCNICECAAA